MVGIDYRIVTRISAPLRVVTPQRGLKKRITLTFQRCVDLNAREQWAGLA